ncbi:class I SAM-dependent methyltransferase [Lysobacter niastensis]|nr:class I SAM-dependent methyltransferase [Lysobacter niastensis]
MALIERCLSDYGALPVATQVSPNDQMQNQWYLEVGRSAVEVILAGLMSSYVPQVNRVLDLPCGHGRVLRHLVRMFPTAEFHACDLDADGVRYCAEQFGAVPVVSRPELSEVDFGTKYDLIWVGSLFTHVAEPQCRSWLAHLAKFLTARGIVVATMHGRWSQSVHQRMPYIGEDRWQEIVNGYHARGYGYADYVSSESVDHVPGNYGISLARPSAILSMLEHLEGIRVFSYSERAWADHQDVVVYGKPAVDEAW